MRKEIQLYALQRLFREEACLEQDDRKLTLDGIPLTSGERLDQFLGPHRQGDKVTATFVHRGRPVTVTVVLEQDPRLEIVTLEAAGGRPTDAQRAFRDAWLTSRQ